MTGQELIVVALGAAALAYLGWRWVVKRRASTCCGAPVCPAAKATAEKVTAPR